MEKILGLDLGTNSIGWNIRNTILEGNQFERYGVITFKKGVGEGKTGEYSLAAERTKNRSVRRLYQARKYRLWETLKVLIENDYCPLTFNDLDQWRKYDKKKGYFRKYPVHAIEFDKWIKLDFDNDGMPDYNSPYQLRKELINKKLEIHNQIDRFKIGRALYHIAQRRGFKSSRKTGDKENTAVYSGSKESGARGVNEIKGLIEINGTLGAALACIEESGSRVRNQYTLRQHYQDEVSRILNVQDISSESIFSKEIIKAIFYQRPLRSQKGLVGKCTLEKDKPRCPVSHPSFEEFRALSFLNNIKYKINTKDEWKRLSLELKEEIYQKKFFRKSEAYFPFIEIREFIEKNIKNNGVKINLTYPESINYNDRTTVSGCPVSARLKTIFGNEWQNFIKETNEIKNIRKSDGSVKSYNKTYNINDIWHVLFSFEDEDCISSFASNKLKLDDECVKEFKLLWEKMPEGYSMLSINAINKILPFLRNDLIYTEAVLLANMPFILGGKLWNQNKEHLIKKVGELIETNRNEKRDLNIVNELIAKWYASDYKAGFKDPSYQLDEKDKKSIYSNIVETYGKISWAKVAEADKENIIQKISFLYQSFFQNDFNWCYIKKEKYYIIDYGKDIFYKSIRNNYFRVPHLLDTIKSFLTKQYNIEEKKLNKLYHPSQVDIYPKSKPDSSGKIYLKSPKTRAFKNPMAMRTLYELRKLINYLISIDVIDEETQIVVELARDLNDANKRWAIETYQRSREEENKEFAKAITELLNDPETFGNIKADPNNEADIDKFRLWYEQIIYHKAFKKTPARKKLIDSNQLLNNDNRSFDWNNVKNEVMLKIIEEKDLIRKYRLWKEQNCTCLYTGRIISLSDLFDENVTDFEHTIPRSISFDSSLANLTVCFADYNRNIKKNRIPSELNNYHEEWNGYSAIEPRLENWKARIEELKTNIEFWIKKAKIAKDKESKDYAIRQRHLWQFDLDYWKNKLQRFTLSEVTSGFKNSQLNDTRLISKYAFHYLKSVFNSVTVQKGSITHEFRKIYGIQAKEENKDRSTHIHHAVDAGVLTLIPSSVKREEILRKSFAHYEQYYSGISGSKQYHEPPYKSFSLKHIEEIKNNILINSIARNNAFTPTEKRARKRGKIVYLRNKEGKIIYDNNRPVPKIIKGDSVRGELHKDTFLGAIKKVIRDEKGNPVVGDNGKLKVEDKITYVVRKPLKYKNNSSGEGFNSLSEIKKCIVDPFVYQIIEKQVGNNNLKDAIAEGIWMYNKKGEKVNKIRRIRVDTDEKDPLAIKEHTYRSKYEYKQNYYAVNATSFLYALYKDRQDKHQFKVLSLFNALEIKRKLKEEGVQVKDPKDLFEKVIVSKTSVEYILTDVFVNGQKVIFYKGDKKDFKRNSGKDERLKKLYKITEFEKDGRIIFKHHHEARKNSLLGKGESFIDFEKYQPKLRLSKDNLIFLIEDKDFQVKPDGEILFYD